ncbi:MAG: hypothetical protein Q7W02_18225 [Candidatus Rokubacteria bacterium]|nr:hypothetical protein [Candidatus Rokubacteria bacterium]
MLQECEGERGLAPDAPGKDLADHFRQSYRLNTTVLPKLSWEPGAVVIGVTAQDMYISAFTWNFAFGYREGDRFALLSTARVDPAWSAEPANPDLLRKRLRKAAAQMVGFLYDDYRETAERRSVMFGPVLGIDDLDRLREDY